MVVGYGVATVHEVVIVEGAVGANSCDWSVAAGATPDASTGTALGLFDEADCVEAKQAKTMARPKSAVEQDRADERNLFFVRDKKNETTEKRGCLERLMETPFAISVSVRIGVADVNLILAYLQSDEFA